MIFKKIRKKVLVIPIIMLIGSLAYAISINNIGSNKSCGVSDLSGDFDTNLSQAYFEEEQFNAPLAFEDNIGQEERVLGVADPKERWIEVDLSEQTLRAWDGDELFMESAVSTGLPWWPTPTGEFRIWVKLRYANMEGGEGKYYYNLPNVPYTMYFSNEDIPSWRGFGLHGTYWHNDFGNQRSHGCVNLPTEMAGKLYYWVSPDLPDGKSSVFANKNNQGTRIIIHE